MEHWNDIEGFEGLYQISNFGRVKSFKGYGGAQERILKPNKMRNGYLCVDLCKNGKRFRKLVHRLVGFAFLLNDDLLKTQINHINEVKTDNRSENLEWVTSKENANFGTRNERAAKALSKTMTNGKRSKTVLQFSLDGEFIREWPSTMEIKRHLGFVQGHISQCCNGKRKTAYKYIWKYKNEEDQK